MDALTMSARTLRGSLLAALLGGCASGVVDADRRDAPGAAFATIPLTATPYNSGRIGRAYLVPNADRTIVRIEASGVPDTVGRPIHLYTFIYEGTCAERAGKAAFALTDTVLASSVANPSSMGAVGGALTIANVAPISLDALRARPYAIVVRTSPADGDRDLYCGEVGSR